MSKQDLDPLFDAWLEDKIIPDMPEYGLYKKDYAHVNKFKSHEIKN